MLFQRYYVNTIFLNVLVWYFLYMSLLQETSPSFGNHYPNLHLGMRIVFICFIFFFFLIIFLEA